MHLMKSYGTSITGCSREVAIVKVKYSQTSNAETSLGT